MDDLNLTLPDRGKKTPGRQRNLFIAGFIILFLLGAANLAAVFLRPAGPSSRDGLSGFAPEVRKALAIKLEKQGLVPNAAAAWKDYLDRTELTEPERAKIWYRMGVLYQEADQCDSALECFYRSEALATISEIQPEINRRTQECLESLGKFASLHAELAERVGLEDSGDSSYKEVLAQIGPHKITLAALDRHIEKQIERQLQTMAPYLDDEQRKKQEEAILSRFADAKMKNQLLNQLVIEELLYRKALEDKLQDDPVTRDLLQDARRKILAQRLLHKLLSEKIHITPADVETYYEANKARYMAPERAKISHILVSNKETADVVLKDLQAGADFTELVRKYSLDESTRGNDGKVSGWIEKGAPVPEIDVSPEEIEAVYQTEPGETLPELVESDRGFHIIKVDEREPETQLSFDEVKRDVYRDLRAAKEKEVTDGLLDELKERYHVVIQGFDGAGMPGGEGNDGSG